MQIKRFFKDEIYLFRLKGHLKHFLENCRFSQKSGNDADSRGWGCHAIYAIMTHCVRKSICGSPHSKSAVSNFSECRFSYEN